MAFNLMAFAGGAAQGLSERLDDEERKYEKLQDEARTRAEKQRLERKASRKRDQKITDELTDKLGVFYNPSQVQDIMTNGKAKAQWALSQAGTYAKAGLDPSTQYSMPDNDIAAGKGNGVSLQTSTVTKLGEVASAAENTPAGLGGGSYFSRFTVIGSDKKDKTLAAYELSLLNLRLEAGNDPERIASVDAKEKAFLDLQRKKAEVTRKGDEVGEKEFYTPTEREAKINKYVSIARNDMDIETGSLGELGAKVQEKLTGTNKLAMANLLAAQKLKLSNDLGYKETLMYGEIDALKTSALSSLDEYVRTSYSKIPKVNVFESKEAMASAATALPPGSLYAYVKPSYTKTVDGLSTVVPEQYIAGTIIGSQLSSSLGIKQYTNSLNLGSNWRPEGN